MSATEPRMMTLNVQVQAPVDWSDQDVHDVLRFHLDITDLNDSDVDHSAVEITGSRLVAATTAREETYREARDPVVTEGTHAGDRSVTETHPAFGMVSVARTMGGGGTALFNSEVQHSETIRLSVRRAERERMLNRDWHRGRGLPLVEIEMSLVQWASMLSSMNTEGVPCTIRATQAEPHVYRIPFAPRLQQSLDEVSDASTRAYQPVREAFEAYAEKKTAANLRSLRWAIENAPKNMTFAAKSLTEHTEEVVEKARADVEAMVTQHALQVGLDPADMPRLALGTGARVDEIPDAEIVE